MTTTLSVLRIPEAYMPDASGRIVRVSPAYKVAEREGFGFAFGTFRTKDEAQRYCDEINDSYRPNPEQE